MLAIGEFIHLELENNDKVYKDIYRAKVAEMGKQTFFIELPINQRTKKTELFRNGLEFVGKLVIDNGTVYQFSTKLINRIVRTIPMLEMTLPAETDFVQVQRRAYVRVDYITDISVQSDRQGKAFISSAMSNISGGGMSIVLPSTFKIRMDDIITCKFKLPCNTSVEEFEENCKVVRLGEREEDNRKADR